MTPPVRGDRPSARVRTPLAAAATALAVVAGAAGATQAGSRTGTGPVAALEGAVRVAPLRASGLDWVPTQSTEPTPQAPSRAHPGFLAVRELPRVPGVDDPWMGTAPVDARDNPSATPCDAARFSVQGVREEQVRTFVVPYARQLPTTFGLSETLGRFPSPRTAKAFTDRIAARLASCERRVSSATVGRGQPVRSADVAGTTWRVEFALPRDRLLRYRMGVVRSGDRVAQVAFSPSRSTDVRSAAFDRLVVRAGQRLAELGRG